MQAPRRGTAAFACVLILAAVSALSAQCAKPDTRVVVFLQGIYTSLDEDGTQTTALEDHRFDTLKAAFRGRGYDDSDMLDFSYAGGTVTSSGTWRPAPYHCEGTDRPPDENVAKIEQLLRDYRDEHRDAHFTLVGHSLGGYLAFLAGARDAARAEDHRLGIDVVVTLDAPLKGASADKKVILDLVDCPKTYLAGAALLADRTDPGTPDVRRYQASIMAREGVRLGTFGNVNDCLWATARCIGGDWIDDGETQFLDGQASVSQRYEVQSEILYSHDAILTHPPAIADVVTFVGAP